MYQEIKENLEIGFHVIIGNEQYIEKEINELNKSKKRFESLCEQFDTPDEIIDATLNDMFPDDDSMVGFDGTFE